MKYFHFPIPFSKITLKVIIFVYHNALSGAFRLLNYMYYAYVFTVELLMLLSRCFMKLIKAAFML